MHTQPTASIRCNTGDTQICTSNGYESRDYCNSICLERNSGLLEWDQFKPGSAGLGSQHAQMSVKGCDISSSSQNILFRMLLKPFKRETPPLTRSSASHGHGLHAAGVSPLDTWCDAGGERTGTCLERIMIDAVPGPCGDGMHRNGRCAAVLAWVHNVG